MFHFNVYADVKTNDLVDVAAEVFGILSDPTRVRLIMLLSEAPQEGLPVGELSELLDRSPSSISQHLAKMRMVRMVTANQDGRKCFYKLTDEHAAQLVREALNQAEHAVANGTIPAHHA